MLILSVITMHNSKENVGNAELAYCTDASMNANLASVYWLLRRLGEKGVAGPVRFSQDVLSIDGRRWRLPVVSAGVCVLSTFRRFRARRWESGRLVGVGLFQIRCGGGGRSGVCRMTIQPFETATKLAQKQLLLLLPLVSLCITIVHADADADTIVDTATSTTKTSTTNTIVNTDSATSLPPTTPLNPSTHLQRIPLPPPPKVQPPLRLLQRRLELGDALPPLPRGEGGVLGDAGDGESDVPCRGHSGGGGDGSGGAGWGEGGARGSDGGIEG